MEHPRRFGSFFGGGVGSLVREENGALEVLDDGPPAAATAGDEAAHDLVVVAGPTVEVVELY